MTKMVTMRIYGKTPLEIFFPGTSGTISMKLGMKHRGIKSILGYLNGHPELTQTNFMSRSKFATYALIQEHVTMNDRWKLWLPVTLEFVDIVK